MERPDGTTIVIAYEPEGATCATVLSNLKIGPVTRKVNNTRCACPIPHNIRWSCLAPFVTKSTHTITLSVLARAYITTTSPDLLCQDLRRALFLPLPFYFSLQYLATPPQPNTNRDCFRSPLTSLVAIVCRRRRLGYGSHSSQGDRRERKREQRPNARTY